MSDKPIPWAFGTITAKIGTGWGFAEALLAATGTSNPDSASRFPAANLSTTVIQKLAQSHRSLHFSSFNCHRIHISTAVDLLVRIAKTFARIFIDFKV